MVTRGWRIHCGVEVTELSTNQQHTLWDSVMNNFSFEKWRQGGSLALTLNPKAYSLVKRKKKKRKITLSFASPEKEFYMYIFTRTHTHTHTPLRCCERRTARRRKQFDFEELRTGVHMPKWNCTSKIRVLKNMISQPKSVKNSRITEIACSTS